MIPPLTGSRSTGSLPGSTSLSSVLSAAPHAQSIMRAGTGERTVPAPPSSPEKRLSLPLASFSTIKRPRISPPSSGLPGMRKFLAGSAPAADIAAPARAPRADGHSPEFHEAMTRGGDPVIASLCYDDEPTCVRTIEKEDGILGASMNQNPPLHLAARRGFSEAVTSLMCLGADLNQLDHRGMTPLAVAAEAGNLDLARQLIEHGADVNRADASGRTAPLLVASRCGHKEISDLLIECGADLNRAARALYHAG